MSKSSIALLCIILFGLGVFGGMELDAEHKFNLEEGYAEAESDRQMDITVLMPTSYYELVLANESVSNELRECRSQSTKN